MACIDDLEDALLETIFALACAQPAPAHRSSGSCSEADVLPLPPPPLCRPNAAIPAVCKRWRSVYESSTLMWRDTRVLWGAVATDAQHGPALQAAAMWLRRRLPACQRLIFSAFPCEPPLFPLSQLFPAGISSPRLREVWVLDARGGTGDAALALLRACPALQAVVLRCPPRAEGAHDALVVRGEALARLGAQPSLRSLDLQIDKLEGSTVGLSAALSALTHLALRCRLESAALAPGLLEGLSSLRRLELSSLRIAQFTPRLAQALGRLTHLSCSDLLAARPRRRAGMTLWQGLRHLPSLRELRLQGFNVGSGMPASALNCSGLQGLTLVACTADEWPQAALHLYTGEGGCLGRLASLHLEDLKLAERIPAALWLQLAPALTALHWRDLRRPDNFAVAAALAAAAQAEEALPGVPRLFRAVRLPGELSALQGLRQLRLEYAQLDAVPASLQALSQLSWLSLEGNRIATLPPGRYLTSLERLTLSNNAFAELPEGLAACSSLRELQLAGNAELALEPASAAATLVEGLPLLERLTLPARPALAGAALQAHMAALHQLAAALGSRLALA